MSIADRFVTCKCSHCDQELQFDPAGFVEGMNCACPHCGLETGLYLPADPLPPPPYPPEPPKSPPRPAKGSSPAPKQKPMIHAKCRHCGSPFAIFPENGNRPNPCPHCKGINFVSSSGPRNPDGSDLFVLALFMFGGGGLLALIGFMENVETKTAMQQTNAYIVIASGVVVIVGSLIVFALSKVVRAIGKTM